MLISSPWDPVPGHVAQSCLSQRRFRLDRRKQFFTENAGKAWNWIPRDVVDAPCLSAFKRHLDNGLNIMLYLLVSPEWFRQLD